MTNWSPVGERSKDDDSSSCGRASWKSRNSSGRLSSSISVSLRKDHGALDHIAQFADVARPRIMLQQLCRGRRKADEVFLQFLVELLHDVERQRQDIFAGGRAAAE